MQVWGVALAGTRIDATSMAGAQGAEAPKVENARRALKPEHPDMRPDCSGSDRARRNIIILIDFCLTNVSYLVVYN